MDNKIIYKSIDKVNFQEIMCQKSTEKHSYTTFQISYGIVGQPCI